MPEATTTGFGAKAMRAMATKRSSLLPVWGGVVLFAAFIAGCSSSNDTSPDMGKVAPKPNPNMSAQLPPEIRQQMSQARVGEDASKMSAMKPHKSNP